MKSDGWAACLKRGAILPATFGRTKADARELAEKDNLPHGCYRIVRVRLVPADAPRRQR